MTSIQIPPAEKKRAALIAMAVAACILLIGLGFTAHSVRMKQQCSAYITATVKEVEHKNVRTRTTRSYRTHTEYRAHIVIDDRSPIGTYALTTGWTRTKYAEDQTVKVFYNPRKPTKYYVQGDAPRSGIGFLILGGFGLLTGLAFYLEGRKEMQWEQDW